MALIGHNELIFWMSGNKPLPEPMLTQICVAILCQWAEESPYYHSENVTHDDLTHMQNVI